VVKRVAWSVCIRRRAPAPPPPTPAPRPPGPPNLRPPSARPVPGLRHRRPRAPSRPPVGRLSPPLHSSPTAQPRPVRRALPRLPRSAAARHPATPQGDITASWGWTLDRGDNASYFHVCREGSILALVPGEGDEGGSFRTMLGAAWRLLLRGVSVPETALGGVWHAAGGAAADCPHGHGAGRPA